MCVCVCACVCVCVCARAIVRLCECAWCACSLPNVSDCVFVGGGGHFQPDPVEHLPLHLRLAEVMAQTLSNVVLCYEKVS